MSADALLDKLDGVRQVGAGRWRARCPAHDGQNRNVLSIGETSDGTTLIKCFHGCTAAEVVAAVGMQLHDLFPPRTDTHSTRGERRLFPAADVLRAVEREALIVAVAASRLGNGGELTEEDRKRLLLASSRLTAAVQETGHA